MRRRENLGIALLNAVVGFSLMAVVFCLALNYLLDIPIWKAATYGVVISWVCIFGHEFSHLLTAREICKIKDSGFELTGFAVIVTVFSILILLIAIYIKQVYGLKTSYLLLIASPGAVYVQGLRKSRCGADIALAGPLYNFVVGVIACVILLAMKKPPYALNQGSIVSMLGLVAYFSLLLAWFNAIPLKIGSVEFDGYHVFFEYRTDTWQKLTLVIVFIVSSYLLFFTHWWIIVIRR